MIFPRAQVKGFLVPRATGPDLDAQLARLRRARAKLGTRCFLLRLSLFRALFSYDDYFFFAMPLLGVAYSHFF